MSNKHASRNRVVGVRLASGLGCRRYVTSSLTFPFKGEIIYVKDKHTDISVEGCATPSLTLGFYTPMKVCSSPDLSFADYGNEELRGQG